MRLLWRGVHPSKGQRKTAEVTRRENVVGARFLSVMARKVHTSSVQCC
jgi:hypothetical protein